MKHHNVTSPKSCQVTREPATLIALIAVKPDYPRRAPVFCLNLHWDGEHNVHNSENIRVRAHSDSSSWGKRSKSRRIYNALYGSHACMSTIGGCIFKNMGTGGPKSHNF